IDSATRPAGGYVGKIMRKTLAAEAETAVFGAEAGRIVGPIKTDRGWLLIGVHALHPATLDEVTREQIKSSLFKEWLSWQRGKAEISAPLLEEIGEAKTDKETRP